MFREGGPAPQETEVEIEKSSGRTPQEWAAEMVEPLGGSSEISGRRRTQEEVLTRMVDEGGGLGPFYRRIEARLGRSFKRFEGQSPGDVIMGNAYEEISGAVLPDDPEVTVAATSYKDPGWKENLRRQSSVEYRKKGPIISALVEWELHTNANWPIAPIINSWEKWLRASLNVDTLNINEDEPPAGFYFDPRTRRYRFIAPRSVIERLSNHKTPYRDEQVSFSKAVEKLEKAVNSRARFYRRTLTIPDGWLIDNETGHRIGLVEEKCWSPKQVERLVEQLEQEEVNSEKQLKLLDVLVESGEDEGRTNTGRHLRLNLFGNTRFYRATRGENDREDPYVLLRFPDDVGEDLLERLHIQLERRGYRAEIQTLPFAHGEVLGIGLTMLTDEKFLRGEYLKAGTSFNSRVLRQIFNTRALALGLTEFDAQEFLFQQGLVDKHGQPIPGRATLEGVKEALCAFPRPEITEISELTVSEALDDMIKKYVRGDATSMDELKRLIDERGPKIIRVEAQKKLGRVLGDLRSSAQKILPDEDTREWGIWELQQNFLRHKGLENQAELEGELVAIEGLQEELAKDNSGKSNAKIKQEVLKDFNWTKEEVNFARRLLANYPRATFLEVAILATEEK